jgi:hypothetical protein
MWTRAVRSPGRRRSRLRVCVPFGAADTGEDAGDDLVPEGEKSGDGAGGLRWNVVAQGAAGFLDQVAGPSCLLTWGGDPNRVSR